MTYNYYCRWIQMIYHATTLQNLYVRVVPSELGYNYFCGNIVAEDDAWVSSY
jgi:hypothetical protein